MSYDNEEFLQLLKNKGESIESINKVSQLLNTYEISKVMFRNYKGKATILFLNKNNSNKKKFIFLLLF